jgi:cellulose synthase operon protein C
LMYSDRILAIDPGIRVARLLHATALVGLGQLDQARREYDSLVHDEPAYTEARLQLAMLDVVQKRFAEGEKLFRDLYRPQDGDFRALRGLVEGYAGQGKLESALGLLNTESSRFPNSVAIHDLLAATAARAGKIDLAIQNYEFISQQQPKNTEILEKLGGLYQRTHNLRRSIEMFQRVHDLTPDDWRTIARLATVQQEAGIRDDARRNYTLAIQLGADNADVFNNLAYLNADMGLELDGALEFAKRALAKAPSDPNFADTAGFVYLKKKDTASALRVFRGLSKKYPQNGGFRYHLALALLQNGETTEGQRELREAVAADPSLRIGAGAGETSSRR